jgi:hypothetical protein
MIGALSMPESLAGVEKTEVWNIYILTEFMKRQS